MQIAKFKVKEKSLVFTLFLVLGIVLPLLKIQLVVGTLINALLFLSVMYFGLKQTIIIGLIPSLISLAVGFLPFFIAPFVPFIMAGNLLLAVLFAFLQNQKYLVRALLAALAKGLFLCGAAYVLSFYLSSEQALAVSSIFGLVQLATAFFGAGLAYVVLRFKPAL
ncbi:MAG: hypothetical protein WC371_00685 [Parachlamydiales bacterium]|jgi:hypothetical protein